MKKTVTVSILGVGLHVLAASVLGAQPLPDGEALLKNQEPALNRFHSIQYIDRTTAEVSTPAGPVGPGKVVSETATARVNPGKSRTESTNQGIDVLLVSDGEATTIYSSPQKEYVKIPAALGPEGVMQSIGMNIPDFSSVDATAKTLRDETIEIDGAPHDCWVVESQPDHLVLPVPKTPQTQTLPQPKITGAHFAFWIDKQLNLALRTDFTFTMQIAAQPPTSVHGSTIKKDLKIDQPISDSLFTFTPPAGAKEVKELSFGSLVPKRDLAGKDAPPFEVKDLADNAYSLNSLKGKPVLLDFWANWCGPCRKSMPVIEKLYREYKNRDLVVLSVNSRENRALVEEFLKKNPLGTPAPLSGDSGILEAYKVQAYPTFVLIGRDGKVAAEQIGFRDEDGLRSMLAQVALGAAPGK
jgi:thiol-disulfide isomerase/thioredoxin